MSNQRKKLLLALISCLVFGCVFTSYITAVLLNTSVYPQVVPYQSPSIEHRSIYHDRFVAFRVEMHMHFQTKDSIESVTTYLDAEGWEKHNFDLIDGIFALYNGYYLPEVTGVSVGPFRYLADSVVIPSDDEKNGAIIKEISYAEIYLFRK